MASPSSHKRKEQRGGPKFADFLTAIGYTVQNTNERGREITRIKKKGKEITPTRVKECIDFWSGEWRGDDNTPASSFSEFLTARNLYAGFLANIRLPEVQAVLLETWLNLNSKKRRTDPSSRVQEQEQEQEEEEEATASLEPAEEGAAPTQEYDGAVTALMVLAENDLPVVEGPEQHHDLPPAPSPAAGGPEFVKPEWVPLKDHKQMDVFKAMLESATNISSRVRQEVLRKAGNEVLVRLDRHPRHYQYKHREFTKDRILHVRRLREPDCKPNKFPEGRVESLVGVAWAFLFMEGIAHENWPSPRFRA